MYVLKAGTYTPQVSLPRSFVTILFAVSDGKKFLQDAEKHLVSDAVPEVCALIISK